uniref:CBM39 domain-containing protein n=1 Tax=Anopheles dirus TaxID=7168 RepID=A0A182NEW9_9DIPT
MRQCAVLICVVAIVVGVAEGGLLDWFRSDKNKGHDVCRVNFEVLDPHGLRMWTSQKPQMKGFGVELVINPVRGRKQQLCNVCRNTTEVTHGKFFLQDENVIVKSGDILEYVIITDNGKTVQRHKPRKLVVEDYLIKPKERCACPVSDVTSTATPARQVVDDPMAEIALLERILERVSEKCAEGAMSSFLFLQTDRVDGAPVDDLKQIVRAYFEKKDALKPLLDTILTAEDASDGIVFRVKSIIDKLKILEIARQDGDIIDFDKLTAIDDMDIRASFDEAS